MSVSKLLFLWSNDEHIMTEHEYLDELSSAKQKRAIEVLKASGIAEIWKQSGCRVNIVGSLRNGLLISHNDIDMHVYSSNITAEKSFAIAAKISMLSGVKEISCINGLNTDEVCISWHVKYHHESEDWKFDIIHIEEGSKYDGYFEKVADKIRELATDEQKDIILRMKLELSDDKNIIGADFYEAVIADDVKTIPELKEWVKVHRSKTPYYWMP